MPFVSAGLCWGGMHDKEGGRAPGK